MYQKRTVNRSSSSGTGLLSSLFNKSKPDSTKDPKKTASKPGHSKAPSKSTKTVTSVNTNPGYTHLDLDTQVGPGIRETYENHRHAMLASHSHILTPHDPSSSSESSPPVPQGRVPGSGWSPNTCVLTTADDLSEYYPSRSSLYGEAPSDSYSDLVSLRDDVTTHSVEIPLRTGQLTASEQAELHKGAGANSIEEAESEHRARDGRGRTGWMTEAEHRVYIHRSRIAQERPHHGDQFGGMYQQARSLSRRRSFDRTPPPERRLPSR
ncbi:hypothetical protein QBC41DRAFT_378962 [Cercophora samala]|uniref:Uncharacterized protein n=1 Tax=Cercophora samala TaxID=330535 RepID=A0AA39Z7Z4_9PEZI|nr:hypothetical protein QBC41DRAFT_378962 [Cercophora samala]